ncbi:hypothetical protein [Halorhabdus sp. CUG00001]|uniref:DUF7261 family protein n=1 Tax=Halorhabdus sp. CUG00001 TaxID=2600297 RepID=UPI00131E2E32|nr:hypothetical protein [Halorhabdus sp. CUG00001]
MVTDRIGPRGERFEAASRGQMLLIGAVLIAVTIVALALVINTVLYTANVGSAQEATQINDVDEFTYEATRNARSIMLRVNHVQRNRSISDVNANTTRALMEYSDGLSRSFATTGTVYANVTYSGTVVNGTRIVQWQDRNFSEPGNPTNGDWGVVPGSTSDIGWFLLNVNVRDTSTTESTISVTHGSETLNYTLNQSANDNLSVIVTDGSGSVLDAVSCQSSGGRALVDLYGGSSPTGECTFPGIEETLNAPMTVDVHNGTEITGQYAIVTNRTWDGTPWNGLPTCTPPGGERCLTPAVWQGSIDLTYLSETVQLSQQRNVSVYGGTS